MNPSLPERPGDGSVHRKDRLAIAGRGLFEKDSHYAKNDRAHREASA